MRKTTNSIALILFVGGCALPPTLSVRVGYFDNTGRNDVRSGGVKMIRIETPKGTFRVWTVLVRGSSGICKADFA